VEGVGKGSRVFLGPQRVQDRALVGDQGECVIRKNLIERLPSVAKVTF